VAKILVIEDDEICRDLIQDMLQAENHTVDTLVDTSSAEGYLRTYQYDLLIVDWNLPGVTGIEFTRKYRAGGGNLPLLMLTGNRETTDKAQGLDSGADDYLTKPFEGLELKARVRALLRRQGTVINDVLRNGSLVLDRTTRVVRLADKEIRLQVRELALLDFFMRHPDEVFSIDALAGRVWSSDSEVYPESVRKCIERLRKKVDLNSEDPLIETVHRSGYRFRKRPD
jgi:DNA-binding response OmpR family regulator